MSEHPTIADLMAKICVPCEGGVAELSAPVAVGHLTVTPAWRLPHDGLRVPPLLGLLDHVRVQERRHVDAHAARADDWLEHRDDTRCHVTFDLLLPLELRAGRGRAGLVGRPRERPALRVENRHGLRP